ncbi:hypothetical protein [Streptomyces sp. NPDC047028]|uniref:hypothetical protein n=1 Tax=Streptomyces sp. NPDC047028 TaxID=3155793 RepID=UPI0033CFEDEE
MNTETVLQETDRVRILIRSWQPGDGLICAHAKRAPREMPCGKPVAVTITEDLDPCWRAGCGTRACAHRPKSRHRRIVCANHIPTLASPGEVTAGARKTATERLIVAHWDEWQKYLDEETAQAVAKRFEFADPEIQRLVMGAAEDCDA